MRVKKYPSNPILTHEQLDSFVASLEPEAQEIYRLTKVLYERHRNLATDERFISEEIFSGFRRPIESGFHPYPPREWQAPFFTP